MKAGDDKIKKNKIMNVFKYSINVFYKVIKDKLIIKKEKKIKNEETEFEKGIFNKINEINPSIIDITNPKYIKIDDKYYSGLFIINYNREQSDLILKSLIDSNINMNISMFYEKKDPYKIVRQLTYYIGNVGVDLKMKNTNKQDIDIAAFSYNDAKYIRKEIQVNNEEFYFLYIYVNIVAEDKKELEYVLNKIEGLIQGKGMQSRRAYFREEQNFISCLPIMRNHEDLQNVTRRNILTSGLTATYPFISSSIFDENGIFIGTNLYNKSLIFINRYDSEKYKNANMCIFGTSGAGKSFFTKLQILRNRLMGIEQYVIDPEREYTSICNYLEGTMLKIGPSSSTYINIFDIREETIEDNDEGYLMTKITKLVGFFNLIFGKMDEEEKGMIEEKIIKCYKEKGIDFDGKSLYKKDKYGKMVFKESIDMPKLEDFYEILKQDKNAKKFEVKLLPFIKGSLKFFNNYTNIKLNNKLIIADVYELGEDNLKYGMYIFTELFWDKIKSNRKIKKAIYLDEVWRLIGVTSNANVASFIYKIFKTIRKYGGSAVAITQDVSDLFSLENGIYGKSILNNSSIKNFFSLEEENIMVLEKYANLSEKEKIEIKSLKKGECIMFVGEEHILAKIECSDLERKVIEGEKV